MVGMIRRFRFGHDGVDYEAIGSYGFGNAFVVTQLQHSENYELDKLGKPSGVDIKVFIADVNTQAELICQLYKQFDGLKDFESF